NLEGEILGVFEVLNKVEGDFTREDEELLSAFAAQAGIAVETATMVDELRGHRDYLAQENAQLRKEVRGKFASPTLLGVSEPMQAVLKQVDEIRDSPVTVLITGESGTGKELVAKALHYASCRASRPFVALNCAALPESLVESELFGVERGVATAWSRGQGSSRSPMAGPCSWTRWETSACPRKPSCCASSRSV